MSCVFFFTQCMCGACPVGGQTKLATAGQSLDHPTPKCQTFSQVYEFGQEFKMPMVGWHFLFKMPTHHSGGCTVQIHTPCHTVTRIWPLGGANLHPCVLGISLWKGTLLQSRTPTHSQHASQSNSVYKGVQPLQKQSFRC